MAKRKLYVNLPVRDLERSVVFFSKLGFDFDPQLTGEKSACLALGGDAFVMLLPEASWKTFTDRAVCDTRTHLQALFSVSCESRAEVDAIVRLAVANGGKQSSEPEDHGFMYDCGFYDLDGHGWGVFWMDPNAAQG